MKKEGVFRGKVDTGRTIAQVEKMLKDFFPKTKIEITIEGSLGTNFRGSRHTDLDIKAYLPTGMDATLVSEIEKLIQDTTGADFYFE